MNSCPRILLLEEFSGQDTILEYVHHGRDPTSAYSEYSLIWVGSLFEQHCVDWTTFCTKQYANELYPRARGLSFKVKTSHCEDALVDDIESAAMDLLLGYKGIRQTSYDLKTYPNASGLPSSRSFRPLVFICHDIGQSVVEKVLTPSLGRSFTLTTARLCR